MLTHRYVNGIKLYDYILYTVWSNGSADLNPASPNTFLLLSTSPSIKRQIALLKRTGFALKNKLQNCYFQTFHWLTPVRRRRWWITPSAPSHTSQTSVRWWSWWLAGVCRTPPRSTAQIQASAQKAGSSTAWCATSLSQRMWGWSFLKIKNCVNNECHEWTFLRKDQS